MRTNLTILFKLIASIILVFSLASCGGKGGDIMRSFCNFTIAINGGMTHDLSDAQVLVGSYYDVAQNPLLSSHTLIWASQGNEGSVMMLTFDGSAIGEYDIEEGNATIYYRDENDTIIEADSTANSSVEGTVTITEYGSVGGFITGSYTITAVYTQGALTSNTAVLTGSFSVIRVEDDYSTIDIY